MKLFYLTLIALLLCSTQTNAQNNKDCTGTSDCVGKIYKETIQRNNQTPLVQVNDFEISKDEKLPRFLDTKSLIRIYNKRKDITIEDFQLGFYALKTKGEYNFVSVKNSCQIMNYGEFKGFECSFFTELPIMQKMDSVICSEKSFSHLANSNSKESNTNDCLIKIEIENIQDGSEINNANDELYMDIIRFYRSN